VRVSSWVWAKSAGFTHHRSRKRCLRPTFLDAQGACEYPMNDPLGAW